MLTNLEFTEPFSFLYLLARKFAELMFYIYENVRIEKPGMPNRNLSSPVLKPDPSKNACCI